MADYVSNNEIDFKDGPKSSTEFYLHDDGSMTISAWDGNEKTENVLTSQEVQELSDFLLLNRILFSTVEVSSVEKTWLKILKNRFE